MVQISLKRAWGFVNRMAVASNSEEVVGRCLLCDSPFDDYSARNRCSLCRLLVLICKSCQVGGFHFLLAICCCCGKYEFVDLFFKDLVKGIHLHV